MRRSDTTSEPIVLEAVALQLVRYALSEDVGTGDITTLNSIPAGVHARAALVAHEDGVVSGVDVARLTFREADASVRFRALADEREQATGDE